MRWHKVLWTAALVAGILLGSSCSPSSQNELPTIAVSLLPEKYFVERMMGDLSRVYVVVPRGSNPETYDPSPRDIARLQSARAYLTIGTLPFEERWSAVLPDSVDLVNIAKRMPRELVYLHHDRHTHLLGDPHYWTSLTGGRAMAEAIRAALTELFPQYAEQIESNFATQIEPKLQEVQALGEELFSSRDSLAFVIYHPSLTLFAQEWGLTQLTIEENGQEPTPKQLISLINTARSLDTKVVLIQEEFDVKNGETIAKELDLPQATIQPLAEDWAEEMKRIMELFR